tara:strand:- start:211 stop:1227 length:1017 start_codon:yes stop_codon:yes gene_type:complete
MASNDGSLHNARELRRYQPVYGNGVLERDDETTAARNEIYRKQRAGGQLTRGEKEILELHQSEARNNYHVTSKARDMLRDQDSKQRHYGTADKATIDLMDKRAQEQKNSYKQVYVTGKNGERHIGHVKVTPKAAKGKQPAAKGKQPAAKGKRPAAKVVDSNRAGYTVAELVDKIQQLRGKKRGYKEAISEKDEQIAALKAQVADRNAKLIAEKDKNLELRTRMATGDFQVAAVRPPNAGPRTAAQGKSVVKAAEGLQALARNDTSDEESLGFLSDSDDEEASYAEGCMPASSAAGSGKASPPPGFALQSDQVATEEEDESEDEDETEDEAERAKWHEA